MNKIRLLKRKEINELRWNELISESFNSLPYAFTWYLDTVAENWDALVLNDFEAVMPLVWLRKMGIKCLYQPYYCQQLGVFSLQQVKASVYLDFLKTASSQFSYININLNPSASVIAADLWLSPKINLLLALNKEYPILQKKYSENHRRNIAKANKARLIFSEKTEIKSFQKFYLENVNRGKENFKSRHEKIFKKLSQLLVTNGTGSIFTACNDSGQLLAAVLIIFHKNRLMGIINTSSAAGKKNGASHFLFDQIIQKFSDSNFTLDFEGSSIATIARFYAGFGAKEECFYNYKNTLLKKLSKRFR